MEKRLAEGFWIESKSAEAVKVNVFHTMEFLLKYSQSLREKVKTGELEIQGAAPLTNGLKDTLKLLKTYIYIYTYIHHIFF